MGKTIKYYKVNKLKDDEFRRVVGVKRETFKNMVQVVRNYYKEKKHKGGTKKSLGANDETLIDLSENINNLKCLKSRNFNIERDKRFALKINLIF